MRKISYKDTNTDQAIPEQTFRYYSEQIGNEPPTYQLQIVASPVSTRGKANQICTSGLPAFQKVLELTRPVNDSTEIWLKLGHNQSVVGNYTPDGHFPIWETKLTNRNDSKSRVKTIQHPDCWEYVSNWAKQNDGGVFFVPTQPQGFPIKDAIALSDDIAAELDEGTAEQQLQLISEFIEISGLKPSYIIHSGSKSYHPHWKATEHLPIEQTVYLRQLICIALNSDPAIANPHQPMRIAGFYRREKGREQTLEYWSESRYTCDQILEGIRRYFAIKDIPFPESISEEKWRIYKRGRRDKNLDLSILTKSDDELYPKPSYSTIPTIPATYTGKIPLHLALSKANQEALRGVGSERNNTGLALALDLIGCDSWLTTNGYSVEGAPYDLFINYCQSCSPGGGWSPREWESIWHSANSKCPTPARQDLTQFIHWYRWSNDPDYKAASIKQWKASNPLFTAEPDLEHEAWLEEQDIIEQAIAFEEFKKELKETWLFAGGVAKAQKKITKIRYGVDPLPTPHNLDELPKIIFLEYQRQQVIHDLSRLGWQKILDNSFCGTGKSYDLGQLENPNPDGKIWLCTKEHRNPTTEGIERNYKDLATRHNGLIEDHSRLTPLGNPFLRNAKATDKPDVPSLCRNAHKFHKLTEKGYNPNLVEDGKTNPICAACPHFQTKITDDNGNVLPKCAAQIGDGYGFMYARKVGLLPDKIRCSIDSLPTSTKRDYSNDFVIIDEADNFLRGTRQIKATIKDIDKALMRVCRKATDSFDGIRNLVDQLYPYLEGSKKTGRWGLNNEEVLEIIGELPEDFSDLIQAASSSIANIKDLVIVPDRINFSQFTPKERKLKSQAYVSNWEFIKEADQLTEENIRDLETNWLIWFLLILSGAVHGSIRVNGNKLILDIPDTTHAEKLAKAKLVYVADATATKRHISQVLQIEENAIISIQQVNPDLSNLHAVSVEMNGLSTNRPSKLALSKRDKVIAKISQMHRLDNPTIISHKREDGTFDWFVDSRGTNRFEGEPVLIASGKPQINWGDARAQYYTLYGTYEGFTEYYQHRTNAEILQQAGRQRAHKYPDQQFTHYFIGTNLDISFLSDYGIKVTQTLGEDYAVEASNSVRKIRRFQLVQTVESLIKAGAKVTQKAIAKELGVTQSWISQFSNSFKGNWSRILKILVSQLNNLDRETNIFNCPSINAFIEGHPLAVVQKCLSVLKDHNWQGLEDYLSAFSVQIQAKILGLLAAIFLPQTQQQFCEGEIWSQNSS